MSDTDNTLSQPGADDRGGRPPDEAADSTGGVVAPQPAPGGLSGELVAAPEYFGRDRQIAPEYTRGFEYMGQVFAGLGVRQTIANHGLDVIDEMMDMESLPDERPTHSYDLSGSRFGGEDQKPLTHFLNAMNAKGATQAEVNAFLNLYADAQRTRAKRAALEAGKSELQRKPAEEMSLDDMRRVMREDRKRWNRDEAMQARYRALLSN